jgi:hypothetical protein
MESPNPFSEEEHIPMLERAFRTILPIEEGRSLKHDPGQSASDMEEEDDQADNSKTIL